MEFDKILFAIGFFVSVWSIIGALNDPIITESGRGVFELTKFVIGLGFIYLSFELKLNNKSSHKIK